MRDLGKESDELVGLSVDNVREGAQMTFLPLLLLLLLSSLLLLSRFCIPRQINGIINENIRRGERKGEGERRSFISSVEKYKDQGRRCASESVLRNH